MASGSNSTPKPDGDRRRTSATDERTAAGDGEARVHPPPTGAEARRLDLLHRLSMLLTRFESIKRDVTAVLTLVSESLSLRTAVVFIAESGEEPRRVSLWHADGVNGHRQRAAVEHLRRAYEQLGRGGPIGELEAGAAHLIPGSNAQAADEGEARFLVLPLVVADGPIFGAVQVEGLACFDESDLAFVNTIVNQLAIALDRHRAVEARRAAAEAARLEAERGRARAEELQQRFVGLVDNLPDAFVWEATAPAREVQFVSGRAKALLGYPEWLKRDITGRVHPDDRAALEGTLAEVAGTQTDRSVEHRMVTLDGRTRWFHTAVAAAVADGRVTGWQGVSIDVTSVREATLHLAEQLNFTRAVTASLGEGVLVVNRDLTVTFLNPRAQKVLGVTQRICGKTVDRAITITSEDGTLLRGPRSPLARVIASGKLSRSDTEFFAGPDQTPIPVSYTASPLRRDGEVVGAALVFRDLLDVRRAEREQRILAQTGELLLEGALDPRETLPQLARSVVPALADVCLIDEVDEAGGVTRIAVAFADPEQQHLAEHARRFAPSSDGASPQGEALRTGESLLVADASIQAIAHDDEHARFLREVGVSSLIVVPMKARGCTLGALTFASAGSGRRYDARDLTLAEEIGRRAASAIESGRLYERAQRATRAREDILAVVSHDLRSPLGVIAMGARLLRESTLPSQARSTVERIARAANRATSLVSDLLDLASMDSGQFTVHPREQALESVLEEAVEERRSAARDAGIDLELVPVPAPMLVRCDPERVLQVLGNLIGNAMKFTPRGGRITVRAEPRELDAVVCVSDTGAGIAPRALPHVFDRYWKLKGTDHKGGAGLGLAIVRGLVKAHGGDTWVESKLGEGTSFWFTLPLAG